MMRLLDGITDSMDIKFEQTPGDDGQESLERCSPCMQLQRVGRD